MRRIYQTQKHRRPDNQSKIRIRLHPLLPRWLEIRLEASLEWAKENVTTLNRLFNILGHLDHQSASALTGHRWYIRWSPQRLAERIRAQGFEVTLE